MKYGYLLILLCLSLCSNADEEELVDEDDGDYITDPIVRQAVSRAFKCADKHYTCTYECNMITNVSGDCRAPNRTTCFNFIVNSNYTLWHTPFPQHLAGLQVFPKCWKVLEPLICSIWYRPCDVVETFNVRRGSAKMSEFIQVFSKDYCGDVRSQCREFEHLLPQELNCDQYQHPRSELKPELTLYNSSCQLIHSYNQTLVSAPPRCIHPLSLSSGLRSVKPVVDQCYLPCRSDFFGHINAFYHFVFVFCTTIALFSPALLIYVLSNIGGPKIPTWVYVWNHCCICIFVYYTLWSVFLFLTYFKKTTICEEDQYGTHLRIDFYTISCKAQRIVLQFLLTSIISWSFVLAYSLLIDKGFKKSSNFTKWMLTVVVYLLAVTLVVMSMIWDVFYADPYYGVCHPGMDPFLSGLFLYIPAVLTSIFLLGTFLAQKQKEKLKKPAEEKGKPLVGINLGGLHINLSFPGLATNLLIFILGAATHFSKGKSQQDEIFMVKNQVKCYTNDSESLMELIGQGNSTSDCSNPSDSSTDFQAIWIFLRMHLLPIIPPLIIVIYLFFALKKGILNLTSDSEGEDHELQELKPRIKEEEGGNEEKQPLNSVNKDQVVGSSQSSA